MNTTAAALQANVTVATIRTWARRGAITATKQDGRWTIDPASLARRITIGARSRRTRMSQPEHRLWDNDHPDIGLLTEATAAGVNAKDIADRVGYGALSSGQRLSNRDRTKVQDLLEWRRERNALLDELAHLSSCFGHDGAAKRASAEQHLTDSQLRKMIKDCYAYAQAHQIDVRTPEQKAPRPATPRQIDYILDLLDKRRRDGDGGGFMQGPASREEIAKLSMDEASTYIDSLKGTY